VPGQDFAALRVDLDLPGDAHPGLLEAEVEAAAAGEKRANS
jgi:hypothetical protein